MKKGDLVRILKSNWGSNVRYGTIGIVTIDESSDEAVISFDDEGNEVYKIEVYSQSSGVKFFTWTDNLEKLTQEKK